MNATPFFTVGIRRKHDALRVRQQARQIAALLHFSVAEQACIAAGTFVIACQALALPGRFRLCFQLEANQLQVFARAGKTSEEFGNRIAALLGPQGQARLRLSKPLPAEQTVAESDLAWLVHNGTDSTAGLFEEVIKQNQEVLTLLHELRTCQQQRDEGQPLRPNAA
jgi:hypothetical protein